MIIDHDCVVKVCHVSCLFYSTEVSCAVYARAVKDHNNVYDPGSLNFKEGDIITVRAATSQTYSLLTQRVPGWGYIGANCKIVEPKCTEKLP